MTVFCRDCKYKERNRNTFFPRCLHPNAHYETVNLVSGNIYEYNSMCDTMRGNDQYCGQEGKWFEKVEIKKNIWNIFRKEK